jgi:hypothetical protein
MNLNFSKKIDDLITIFESDNDNYKQKALNVLIRILQKVSDRSKNPNLQKKLFNLIQNTKKSSEDCIKTLVILRYFFQAKPFTESYIELKHLEDQNIEISLKEIDSLRIFSKTTTGRPVDFNIRGIKIIITPRNQHFIIQEYINGVSVVLINKLFYVLASGQYYQIKNKVFMIKKSEDMSKLELIVYSKSNSILELQKNIEIFNLHQNIALINDSLKCVSRDNLSNLMFFDKNNRDWILTTNDQTVFRYLGNPETQSNTLSYPISIFNGSLIKIQEKEYIINSSQ